MRERAVRCCCFHADIDPNATEPANGFATRPFSPATLVAGAHLEPGDRETTAGEICREICPAVRASC